VLGGEVLPPPEGWLTDTEGPDEPEEPNAPEEPDEPDDPDELPAEYTYWTGWDVGGSLMMTLRVIFRTITR
jgi:hypothetical protein